MAGYLSSLGVGGLAGGNLLNHNFGGLLRLGRPRLGQRLNLRPHLRGCRPEVSIQRGCGARV